MRKYDYLLGLPPIGLNSLCIGIAVLTGCFGWRVLSTPNIAFKMANTQLITASSADKLGELARKLEVQAKVIEQKDKAYEQLDQTYNAYLLNQKGDIELGQAIEAIDDLPEIESIEEIKTEISVTEEVLRQSITE